MNRQKKEELKRAQQQQGGGHREDGDQQQQGRQKKPEGNNSRVAVRANPPAINSGRPTLIRVGPVSFRVCPLRRAFFQDCRRVKKFSLHFFRWQRTFRVDGPCARTAASVEVPSRNDCFGSRVDSAAGQTSLTSTDIIASCPKPKTNKPSERQFRRRARDVCSRHHSACEPRLRSKRNSCRVPPQVNSGSLTLRGTSQVPSRFSERLSEER